MKARRIFIIISVVSLLFVIVYSIQFNPIWWLLFIIAPFIILGVVDINQNHSTIRKNFPVIGHLRFLLESFRPEIMQYFVETDTEGKPFNRIFRSIIYQRSKKEMDTTPFGTQMDVYRAGYEWMAHSMYIKTKSKDIKTRLIIGGKDCTKPYDASILNISAMSFGALSKNAVMALNKGAKLGNFAHNTGEGGVSPHHLKHGGDLIWQVGTGYFGCRKEDGTFCEDTFKKNAIQDEVKMIEIKVSQGAKPGHGGILPAAKNTEEIAQIRHVKPFEDVHSPPTHSSFSNPTEMMSFIKKLRNLSGGKPVGFKLAIGKKDEFIALCNAMIETNITPDFITVDGGEGGTGAAPLEFSNSLGMPLREGLSFVSDTLKRLDLKKDIKIIASGKIVTGFHMARVIALGADACNSARAMMMSIGCIQALECNNNTCPVGVATQDKQLMKGLNVENKSQRAMNFHEQTIDSFTELISAAGFSSYKELQRKDINRRVSTNKVLTYEDLYPYPVN